MIGLSVIEVRTAVPAGVGTQAGLVVLIEDDEPYRMLRIIVGQPEARAIQAARLGDIPARPSTWDLFVSALSVLGVRLTRAVLTSVEDRRHFFASVELEHDGRIHVLDCRPSDALALALRGDGAMLCCAPEVLDQAGYLAEGS
jgi:bifunctional DNase/RNase